MQHVVNQRHLITSRLFMFFQARMMHATHQRHSVFEPRGIVYFIHHLKMSTSFLFLGLFFFFLMTLKIHSISGFCFRYLTRAVRSKLDKQTAMAACCSLLMVVLRPWDKLIPYFSVSTIYRNNTRIFTRQWALHSLSLSLFIPCSLFLPSEWPALQHQPPSIPFRSNN